MQIVQVIAVLSAAGDADAVGAAVAGLGRSELGLSQCGVSWQRSAENGWWSHEPVTFERLLRAMRIDHAPVGQPAASDGIHKLLLPVVEPGGLLGAICVGHGAPLTPEQQRDLAVLATHVSVRLVQLGARAANDQVLGKLTPRQVDVALLAAKGRPNAAIASALGLSENTVKKHLKDIFDLLGIANRTELAARLSAGPRHHVPVGVTRRGDVWITRSR